MARGKPGTVGIGGVLGSVKGEILIYFSKPIGIKDSNKADVLSILETLITYIGHLA